MQKDMATVKAFYAPIQGIHARHGDAQRAAGPGQMALESLLKQELLTQVFIEIRADLFIFIGKK